MRLNILLLASLAFLSTNAQAQQQGKTSKVYIGGKVTEKTKYIDCDRLYAFSMGAAVIQKGNAYALINAQGDIVIPFNRYKEIMCDFGSSIANFFYATRMQSPEGVYITSQGKEVTSAADSKNGYFFDYTADKKFLVAQKESKDGRSASVILIDTGGKRTLLTLDGIIASPSSMNAVNDSAIVYRKDNKFGFKNYDGTGLSPQFDRLEPFSCGVAVFGKINEFGQLKFGIINRKGKIVFPAQLSYQPSPFEFDATLLKPATEAEFRTAIVNTQGEVVYKNTEASMDKYGQFFRFTPYFVLSANYMLDKKGKVISQTEFLNQIGIAVGTKGGFQTGKFTFSDWYRNLSDSVQRFVVTAGKMEFKGFYNPHTEEILLCHLPTKNVQNWSDKDSYVIFDNKSGLAHVVIEDAKGMMTDGYINRRGEFVIIRKTSSSNW